MINILGQDIGYIKRVKGDETHIHMYHKDDAKVNRKMGHITIVTNSKDQSTKIKNSIIKE